MKINSNIATILSNIINEINNLQYKKYALKLDNCHYDKQEKSYIIGFRYPSKRNIINVPITLIKQFDNLLNYLHPSDSFFLGELNSMQSQKVTGIIKHNLYADNDRSDYIMESSVELIETDMINNLVKFRHKHSNKITAVHFSEMSAKHPILNAVNGSEAFNIGQVIANNYIQHFTF